MRLDVAGRFLSSEIIGPEFSCTVVSTANTCVLEPKTKKYISFYLKCHQDFQEGFIFGTDEAV